MNATTNDIEQLAFLSEEQVREIAKRQQTPVFVYSKSRIVAASQEVLAAFDDMPFGLTVRYAMKANPHPQVIQTLGSEGIQIDASSEFEARDALSAGVAADDILLTSQQLPQDMSWIGESGVHFTATSLHQLEEYGKHYPGSSVSIRLNTGLGSGANHRLTTGGIEVGFGIWFHRDDDRGADIDAIATKYDLTIERVHIHIGTGSDPAIWEQLMEAGISALEHFTEATTLNLGGGFKLPYMKGEIGADLPAIGDIARRHLNDFARRTGRQIHFEVEPGRYLVARAGSLIASIIDRSDTGEQGDTFLKLNTGMNDILRTPMYGALHPLISVSREPQEHRMLQKYVVIGHCCESSDILTTKPGDPESIEPRPMHQAGIGDYMVIEMAGAYCAGMRARGYNSFPDATELVID